MGKFSELAMLLDESPPSQRHSETSKAAAKSMKGKLGPLHHRILAYLESHREGSTDEQMQIELDMLPSTERPRRIELQARGRVCDSGRTTLTRSGRKAIVWVLT
jgi:hypothetical protein